MPKRSADPKLPPGITRRGSRFLAGFNRKGYARQHRVFDTLPEAVAWRQEMDAKVTLGQLVPEAEKAGAAQAPGAGKGWTVERMMTHAKVHRWDGTRAERTQGLYADAAVAYFGASKLIRELTSNDILDYVQHLKDRRNSNSTINKKLSALRVALRMACDDPSASGLAVMPKLPFYKPAQGRLRFLSDDEERELLGLLDRIGTPDTVEAADVLRLMIDTGARNSEIWGIQARDFMEGQGKHGALMIYGEGDRTKTGKARSVPLTERGAVVLRAAMRRQEARSGSSTRLFPLDNFKLLRSWNTAASILGRAEEKDWVPYICRHTCCSRLVMAGVPLPVVQKWMGHETIMTTMRYAHLAPRMLDEAAAALDAWGK